jgi:predicted CoA-substrate-specific enzyme activase
MTGELRSLGVCLGAATLSMALIKTSGSSTDDASVPPRVTDTWRIDHGGNPRQALLEALGQIDTGTVDRIACTGRKFRELVNLSTIPEPEAVEYAYRHLRPDGVTCPAVVSAGGETFMAYVLNPAGRITNVLTGNRCASGTGEFFLQQLRRLGMTPEEAVTADTDAPYRVSGRCSVFCKSDCTHATNKGVPKTRVAAGLSRMMADRLLGLLTRVPRNHIMLTGGTVHNRPMMAYLAREITAPVVPENADCFEAIGAALWGLSHPTRPFPGESRLFLAGRSSFSTLGPLSASASTVSFREMPKDTVRPGDHCLLGLDVGSTTTKAVLIRQGDDALLASVYLRTNGDPVKASRECYRSLLDQVTRDAPPDRVAITGLGVCGSGRQIAGLHAQADGIVNEIIAHATAATYFDPEVDTLFEIGGQDAKYTLITDGVPSDYAMNEACSAGTGSFLEESALETLGIGMEEIEAIAITARKPPNFNDQCAAFISSDIKNAIHDGVSRRDIVAGLVYSICMNYTNRVKGNRPVGRKIFMQGGVCYNRAVPLAMAALVGKPIIVPPEPGLMGAFGAALEVKRRMAEGRVSPGRFDLKLLGDRSVAYGKPFICRGGREGCDRRCEIARVRLAGKTYPFGGACNRYYNLRSHAGAAADAPDLVKSRHGMVFATGPGTPEPVPVVAMNRSYMINTYFPFFETFFRTLGFGVRLPEAPSRAGADRCGAAFCYPGELAHGFFHTLLDTDPAPAFLFLPHFKSIPGINGDPSTLCPLVQSESYYLKSAFRKELASLETQNTRILSPVLNMAPGLAAIKPAMLAAASAMGAGKRQVQEAFDAALAAQERFAGSLKAMGRNILSGLPETAEGFAVVLFGRAYNAFAPEAHMGIPGKFASRGIPVIPFDALDFESEVPKRHMYWGMGRQILQAARQVRKHPRLFGVYITNFSCGPDSFLLGYFRQIMGSKPSLTLELDSHTADAGLETRVEAFLDIVSAHCRHAAPPEKEPAEKPLSRLMVQNGTPVIQNARGTTVPLNDPRVTVLVPSMGKLSSEAVAAAFRGCGLNATAHPPADETILKLGRAHTTGKECLPLILTTGTLLSYLANRKRPDEIVAYFMATTSGPCRFGQYAIFMEDLIRRRGLDDVVIFSLNAANGYQGLKNGAEQRLWWALVISDILEDIRAMLLANAADTAGALTDFEWVWQGLLGLLEKGAWKELQQGLESAGRQLGRIPLKRPSSEVPVVGLVGEIFVRRDGLSRQWITERLAEKGIASVCAPVGEWIHYCDYLVNNNLAELPVNLMQKSRHRIRSFFKGQVENRIRSLLSTSGLIPAAPDPVGDIIDTARPYLSPDLTGEAILTIGSSLTQVAAHCCGVICIGPFGCMPTRIAEAILSENMTVKNKTIRGNGHLKTLLPGVDDLPFLAIESDGSPFPHLIHAKMEAFCLRALRLHERMKTAGTGYRATKAKGVESAFRRWLTQEDRH